MARWFLDRGPHRGAPSVNLRRLLPDAQFVGRGDGAVSAYSSDAARVDPGEWFVAVPGEGPGGDGTATVVRALERGVSGVVVERPCAAPGQERVPLQVVVGDARSARARIEHALAGDPAARLPVVGVAGASGRAEVGAFLRAILRAEGRAVGSVGADTWFDGESIRPIGAWATGAGRLAAMLSSMVKRRAEVAVVEVDPAAIDRREVDGIAPAAVVVTSLADPDDRPADSPAGRQARRRSLARLARRVEAGGVVVLDADDPEADVLGAANLAARRATYGIDPSADSRPRADVSAVVEGSDARSCRFLLRGFGREVGVTLRVGGGVATVRHALAAAAVAWARGVEVDAVVRGLESVARIPGRFEPVRAGQPFEVRVDRAGSPEALARALGQLRALVPGRVLCVVGAEGVGPDGRPDARAALGRVVEVGADVAILTAGDARAEDANQVVDEIRAGMVRSGRARVELDRRAAIALALAHAGPGDGVLIAGPGDPVDDAALAARLLRGRDADPA